MYLCVPMCVYVDQYSLYQFFFLLLLLLPSLYMKKTQEKTNKTKQKNTNVQ
jgi:hypothetical protein